MSAVAEHVRESVLTAPEDLEHHALLPWARGEEPLPVSEYRVIDTLVREWWEEQADAAVLLRALAEADRRAGVLGACACTRWALERYWSSDDRRPWIAAEATEAWCRGSVTMQQVRAAREGAWAAATAAAAYAYAADAADAADAAAADDAAAAAYAAAVAAAAAYAAAYAADAADAAADADAAAYAAYAYAAAAYAAYAAAYAYAAYAEWHRARTEALRTLCDVVRAAVECPPAEVWMRVEDRS